MPVGELSVGEMSIGELSVGELSVGEMSGYLWELPPHNRNTSLESTYSPVLPSAIELLPSPTGLYVGSSSLLN